MSTAFVGHGIAAECRGFAFRNCIDISSAIAFLKGRKNRSFVSSG
jgi:hypothetical protein